MEESVETAKLVIYVAESGQSFELDCPTGTLVQLVQTCLASLTRVAIEDQLLICDDMRLEAQRTLEFYRLPAEERPVFLYNRARLLADVPPPPPEHIQVKDVVLPTPPIAPPGGHPLDKAFDRAINVLPAYEQHFRFHFEKGLAIFNGTHDRFEICRRLLHEKQVQGMAFSAAKRNMNYHYKMIDQMYTDFMKYFNRQQKQHADILANLDKDVDGLRKCKLHPSLIRNGWETLWNCLDTSDLYKQAQICTSSHKQLHSKVRPLKAVFLQLHQSVESFSELVPSVDVYDSERSLTANARVVDEEKTIMQSLSKDLNTVKNLVDECTANNPSRSTKPHDAVSALGPMYEVHVNSHLPKMEHCYQQIEKLLESFVAKKHEMGCCLHSCMQKVASLQSSIRDVRNQLTAFKEASMRQDEIFKELKVVRWIGPAYRACLAEAVRRKADMKLYMGQAGQLAEKMARSRESEIARRDEFVKMWGCSLPQEILVSLGLFGLPSQCIINIEPYDGDLLDVDIMDLEKYAPEMLFGPYSKGVLTSSCRSIESKSFADVSVSAEFENGDVDASDDEVSGTNKLEVENAWLKAELASKVALSCGPDHDFEALPANGKDLGHIRRLASQKTAEALALKDDYAKHLQNSLKASQRQSHAYAKRIRELEQRLAVQHDQSCKQASNATTSSSMRDKSEVSGVTGNDILPSGVVALEPIDDSANSASPLDEREHIGCYEEGGDESVIGMPVPKDTAMSERADPILAEGNLAVTDEAEMEKLVTIPDDGHDGVQTLVDIDHLCGAQVLSPQDKQYVALQDMLVQKTRYCIALEEKFQLAVSDADSVRKELQEKAELLRECQFNCAELETSLHLAREESRIKQCSVDRKVAEYNTLRTSSVRLHGLLERLRHCISSSVGGCTELADSLQALTASLASNDGGDAGTADFVVCVRGLAERVGRLAQQQADLLEHCSVVENRKGQLATELESKVEMLKSQYAKRKLDKQVNKEKICYTRFQVHELAMFTINASGHYEAINRGCPNYYLSDESVALFLQNLPDRPLYIIGQIVHIERNVVRLSIVPSQMMNSFTDVSSTVFGTNPYGLPYGTVYFVVTLAMVPDRLPCLPLTSAEKV